MAGAAVFIPTVEDHIAAQRLWLAGYWRRRRLQLLAALCGIVFAAAIALAAYSLVVERRQVGTTLIELAWPLAAPFIFAAIQLVGWVLIPRSVRRMSREHAAMLTRTEWRWDDLGCIVTSGAGSAIVRWSDLHRWLIGSASIVLLPSERMLLVLPLRAVTATERDDLKATIERFARTRPAA